MSDLRWEDPVERQIREATERGQFDNLPGTGKALDTSDHGPGWWVRRYVERLRKLDEDLDTAESDRSL